MEANLETIKFERSQDRVATGKIVISLSSNDVEIF